MKKIDVAIEEAEKPNTKWIPEKCSYGHTLHFHMGIPPLWKRINGGFLMLLNLLWDHMAQYRRDPKRKWLAYSRTQNAVSVCLTCRNWRITTELFLLLRIFLQRMSCTSWSWGTANMSLIPKHGNTLMIKWKMIWFVAALSEQKVANGRIVYKNRMRYICDPFWSRSFWLIS